MKKRKSRRDNRLSDIKEATKEHFDTKYRIGLRVIKSALAIMVCLGVSRIFSTSDLLQASAVSALITLQTTRKDTLHTGAFRLLGTVVGGLLGLFTVLLRQHIPFYHEFLFILIIPLVIVIDLYLCNVLKIKESSSISCIVIIWVVSFVGDGVQEIMQYAVLRVLETMFGVGVAMVLNLAFLPHENKLKEAEENKRKESLQHLSEANTELPLQAEDKDAHTNAP